MSSQRVDNRRDVVISLSIPRPSKVPGFGGFVLYDTSGVEVIRVEGTRVIFDSGFARDGGMLSWNTTTSQGEGNVGGCVESSSATHASPPEDEKTQLADRQISPAEVPTLLKPGTAGPSKEDRPASSRRDTEDPYSPREVLTRTMRLLAAGYRKERVAFETTGVFFELRRLFGQWLASAYREDVALQSRKRRSAQSLYSPYETQTPDA